MQGRLSAYDRIKIKVEQSKASETMLQASGQKIAVDGRLQDDVINIMDKASTPEPTKPGFVKDLSIGALCGAFLGILIVFLSRVLRYGFDVLKNLLYRFLQIKDILL